MLKTKRPIRITVQTHGQMLREQKSVGFYIPENMRFVVVLGNQRSNAL